MIELSRIVSRLTSSFLSMPRLLCFGVVVFVVSGAIDLLYHGVSAFWPGSLDAYLGPDGYYVHLALFFGMVFIIIGVVRTKSRPDPDLMNPMNSLRGDTSVK
jgi:hypothetical protein